MRLSAALLLVSCASLPGEGDSPGSVALDGEEADLVRPPPELVLTPPPALEIGALSSFVVSGDIAWGERVLLGLSRGGLGPGPCLAAAGGACMDIRPPLRLAGVAEVGEDGTAVVDVWIGAGTPEGWLAAQAVVVRGIGGDGSLLSGAVTVEASLDPPAVLERTVIGFAGALGPDLTADGYTQCAGTDDGGTLGVDFYAPCEAFDTVMFGCSVDGDETAEFLSSPIDASGFSWTDGSCDDFPGGSNSPYSGDYILSIDATDPTCGEYSVGFDMYVDFVNPQWGCSGVSNTDVSGGRIFAYGLVD